MEQLPQVSEDPRRVVLKLEVVLCRGDKLISGAAIADLSVLFLNAPGSNTRESPKIHAPAILTYRMLFWT